LRFSRRRLWRMPSSGMLGRVALVRTEVSEERSASIIRMTRIVGLGTLSVTSNRCMPRRNTMGAHSISWYLIFCSWYDTLNPFLKCEFFEKIGSYLPYTFQWYVFPLSFPWILVSFMSSLLYSYSLLALLKYPHHYYWISVWICILILLHDAVHTAFYFSQHQFCCLAVVKTICKRGISI
jgi:hypothetical protein